MTNSRSIAEEAHARPRKRKMTPEQQDAEKARCKADEAYFINTYCKIFDNDRRTWIDFTLWPVQVDALKLLQAENRTIYLKARQEGFTWLLGIADSLWDMLFNPIAEILMFSQREDEALHLLSDQRLRGMHSHLPPWMQLPVTEDNKSEWRLLNESGVRALPSSAGGDSRTVTKVFIDEGDLVDDLQSLLTRAEPTVGKNGKIVIVGRADKSRPNSPFKRLYVAAKAGETEYKPFFAPWNAHPGRTQEWYDAKCKEAIRVTGSMDSVHEQYPATDVEALQARTLDKRISPDWIRAFTQERLSLSLPPEIATLPGLKIFAYPQPGHKYGIGSDPSGGLPDGDDAVSNVVDEGNMSQVAVMGGKIEPTQFANYTHDLSAYYNGAAVLPELNNHGWAMLAQLKERHTPLRTGLRANGDPGDPGWITSDRSKHLLYDTLIKVFQEFIAETMDEQGDVHLDKVGLLIFDFLTSSQLASIEASTLKAPENMHDDYATAYALALMCVYRGTPSMERVAHVGLFKSTEQNDKLAQLRGAPLPVGITSAQVLQSVPQAVPEQHYLKPRPGETMEEWAWRIRFRGR